MFAVSTKIRYGLRAMLRIALIARQKPVSVSTIAEQESISQKYLEAILQGLKKAGLLKSSRGPEGGYQLSLPAEQISLRRIVEAIDGPVLTVGCVPDREVCDRADNCLTRGVWSELQERLNGFMEERTLAMLIDEFKDDAVKPECDE